MIKMRAKSGGFSLVELLIGITIGLFLLAGLLTFFGQNRAAYSYQQSQSGQQDSERLANILFTNVLQQAGFSEMTNQRILNRASLFPAGGLFADGQAVVGTEATATVSLIGGGTQTVANDSIAIRFWDGVGIIDCIGNAAPAGAMSVVLFSVDGVNLNCRTDGMRSPTANCPIRICSRRRCSSCGMRRWLYACLLVFSLSGGKRRRRSG